MAINRRNLLRAAGVGVGLAALGSATGCLPDKPAAILPVQQPAGQVDWAALRQRLAGTLNLPSDSGYPTAKLAYNPLFDGRQPAAVAQCANASDVQACVSAAANARIPVAARSGGHSYGGYSTPDSGLVVDLGGMTGVEVKPDGTAVIGAGTRLMDVYTGLAAAGRCLPAGSCPTVGISGLTLGGGIGVLTGKYGLTCDNLISAQVVTADGTLRTASATSEPELFWALRGGGGGNFGIVTSFTFRTVAAPQLAVFQVRFPAGSLTEVLAAWQTFTKSAPDEFWSTLGISAGSPPTCRINGCYVGTESAMNTLLDKLVTATKTQPVNRYSLSKDYLSAMMYFGGCANYSVQQCRPNWNGGGVLGGESFTASSRVLTKPLSDPSRLTALRTGREGMDILLDSLSGAPARIGAKDTAFPYRGALATAQIYVGATTSEARNAVNEVRDGLGELTGNTAFVNYIDPGLSNWASAYYGDNAVRLRGVAKHYDPNGVFTFDQSAVKV
ncbi:FAD-binding oxidoreductase [Nocardia seriolae]|uniref:FAD-binding oxidoreductase n=1 Tax=Nocardia seriolae TaxID=37332 RepID=UPI000909E08E|nr:FAD-dependent oxidoreductase [Nocardia seriolae]MTJ63981.1 FAD-binding protein [Nocardia seriolae]MTJ71351.1 FAD-binding protein [Nocardia seriolae]MTJ88542.1 FAD-binding protein [Nocardia seriolae]MTK32526.1 FAD-binding protein [Nocardia seriolae]MTK41867.1 FAD-binding protein [Nocardia seriolae]